MERAGTVPVSVPIRRVVEVSDEDRARARWYRFLAGVFAAAPDAELLARLAAGAGTHRDEDVATPLGAAWGALAEQSVEPAREGPDAVAAEYDRMFIGVGRAPVALHASWYLTGFLNERPLAELRTLLATWGFARREDAVRTEDHVASLLEAMAMLADSDEPDAAARQRELFERYLAPWYARLAEAIDACAEARWYRPVAAVLKTFLDVERQAFDFES